MTGELLGLGGLSTGRYECDAIALEDSTVCVVPLAILEQACHHTMIMQCHVHRLFGREIERGSNLMLLLGTMNSEQRVASFLVELSIRLRSRGYSAT
jgi:CRP/FNR family transcriptional regulator, anaerobic regulatory protein